MDTFDVTIFTRICADPEVEKSVCEVRTYVMIRGQVEWSSTARADLDTAEINSVAEAQQTEARTWVILTLRGRS